MFGVLQTLGLAILAPYLDAMFGVLLFMILMIVMYVAAAGIVIATVLYVMGVI